MTDMENIADQVLPDYDTHHGPYDFNQSRDAAELTASLIRRLREATRDAHPAHPGEVSLIAIHLFKAVRGLAPLLDHLAAMARQFDGAPGVYVHPDVEGEPAWQMVRAAVAALSAASSRAAELRDELDRAAQIADRINRRVNAGPETRG